MSKPSSAAKGERPGTKAHPEAAAADGRLSASFAQRPDVGGPLAFSSPDTPGMPPPSPKTAWDFMPEGWTRRHGRWEPPAGFEPRTQLDFARLGETTPEMKRVAEREPHLSAGQVRDEVAAGRMIIPANRIHLGLALEPMAIGRASRTKINANIGASPVSSGTDEEVEKLRWAVRWGADTVMDLSTGGDVDACREAIIRDAAVPIGTVPMYSMIIGRDLADLGEDSILEGLEHQARQGVDYFTIHAGILREAIPLAQRRLAGIVSRGGSLLAKWMTIHDAENPTYTAFDRICDIMHRYDVAFSLGDGLRPGSLADATDSAQLFELRTIAKLTERGWRRGCQVMVEGPGHVPFDGVEYNMKLQRSLCHGAPFYVLGPLVSDVFAGYDHITSAIGSTAAAYHGASMLCYVTPKEHLGLPRKDDVKQGCVAHKIAAHAADVALGIPSCRDWDDEVSRSRADLQWKRTIELSYDSERARALHDEDMPEDTDYCAMCGHDWCAVRISNELSGRASASDHPDEPSAAAELEAHAEVEPELSTAKPACHSDVAPAERARKMRERVGRARQ